MEDKKVIILMSTYNGEKYIKEQMESIFNQTYKNIKIFVRDDGSKDNTLNILKEYENQGKIKLSYGENLGFAKSFYWLLENTEQSDYYSFADQDDIWLENKIENAVNILNNMDNLKPALYFCDFDFYDKDMNFISHKNRIKAKITLQSALVNNINCGFTTVINYELLKYYLLMPAEKNIPHDYLALIIAVTLGNVYYDFNVLAKYRRHDRNVSSEIYSNNFFKIQLNRINNFLINDKFNYKKRWIEINNIYNNYFDCTIKNIFRIYTNYKLINNLKKLFCINRYRDTILDELAVRFIFLIGKL